MLERHKNIFLIGAGGIGMSGLGRILQQRGKSVSGADASESVITRDLTRAGIGVFIGHNESNIFPAVDLVIYSQAVPADNPERLRAKNMGIRELSYPEALGEILKGYFVIAVAGTNGKTTTTGMLASIMETAGLDPTVLLGSKMKQWDSNARVGESKYFLLEADEYRRGFLNYRSDIAVITNISADHLDYYKDENDVKRAFAEFIANIKQGGRLVYNTTDKNSRDAAGKFLSSGAPAARGFTPGKNKFKLRVPGEHNEANAAAAAEAAKILSVKAVNIARGLEKFRGTWRRFERVGRIGGADIISDYAHHPDGVRVLLQSASKMYKRPLFVYQPHQHNRTKSLFREFCREFCAGAVSDILFVEIFDVAGRERGRDQDISSRDLVNEISKCKPNVSYAKDLKEAERAVRSVAKNHDAVFVVGAGDIYLMAERLGKNED